jgi:hypothetical protein
MNSINRIPVNHTEAVAALVESDVARWGESERQASLEMRRKQSYGLLLNELAGQAQLAGEPCAELWRAAQSALTRADWRILKGGG